MTVQKIHPAKGSAARQNDGYLQVKHLSRSFEQKGKTLKVLQDIDFRVGRGELICIVGASGCGKSTLLRAVAGLDPDHEGSVLIDGKEVTRPSKERGIVFQEHRLFPWMTVAQNVNYALNRMNKEQRTKLVREYLNLVGLSGFERAYPRQLSGGMAQRAGIARALVNSPSVLLLDEPFAALDAFTRITMQQELKRIQKQSKVTMLMVTHDTEEAVYLADRVLVFSCRPGKIKRVIPVELPEPRDRNSSEFLEIRREVYNEFFDEEREFCSSSGEDLRMSAG